MPDLSALRLQRNKTGEPARAMLFTFFTFPSPLPQDVIERGESMNDELLQAHCFRPRLARVNLGLQQQRPRSTPSIRVPRLRLEEVLLTLEGGVEGRVAEVD